MRQIPPSACPLLGVEVGGDEVQVEGRKGLSLGHPGLGVPAHRFQVVAHLAVDVDGHACQGTLLQRWLADHPVGDLEIDVPHPLAEVEPDPQGGDAIAGLFHVVDRELVAGDEGQHVGQALGREADPGVPRKVGARKTQCFDGRSAVLQFRMRIFHTKDIPDKWNNPYRSDR